MVFPDLKPQMGKRTLPKGGWRRASRVAVINAKNRIQFCHFGNTWSGTGF
jgi:hypothetical protein